MSAPAAPTSSPNSVPGPASGAGAGRRVLVIDDSQTILKVVHTILHLNGFDVTVARDGVEGFEQIDKNGPFDVVLLDFVMPRMNGYQFCRKLRSDKRHKGMPVVLMSARTATIGDRFVEQTGAADALGKPFDARALVAVVQAVLAKKDSGKAMPNPESMVDEEELDAVPVSAPPPSRHGRSMGVLGTTIAKALVPKLLELDESARGQAGALEQAIVGAIDEGAIARMIQAIDTVDVDKHGSEVLRGHLGRLPLAEILQTLQLRRQTGVITVTHGDKRMHLYIKDGMLDLATSTGTDDEFRLGRYFVEAGWMTREEVDAELEKHQDSDMLFGDWLMQEDFIQQEHLTHALLKQSAELVYEVLRWPEGIFVLKDEPFTPEAESASLGLGISELVLEGFRRVDEWRHMADTVDFEAVLVVDQVALGTLDESKISSTERPILDEIDGKKTAREVMEASEVASFDAIKALYRFLQSRIVRTTKGPRAPQKSLLDEPSTAVGHLDDKTEPGTSEDAKKAIADGKADEASASEG